MSRLPPDYLILKRREQEDARRVYEDHGREQSKVGATTAFEVRTDAALGARRLNERYIRLQQQDAAALEGRRRRLAELLAAEQADQAAALEALEETPEQRKEKMVARAKELRERREAEKQAFVKEQYERQWRLSCDPLRARDSKLIQKATNEARAYQLGEKLRALELEEAEERAFDKLWEQDRLSKEGREEADALARKAMGRQHTAILDRQVNELHRHRARERELSEREAALLREQATHERAEAAKVDEIRRRQVRDSYAELGAYAAARQSLLSESEAREKAEDEERLAAGLAAEAAQEEKEAAARHQMQQTTRSFADSMMAQKRANERSEGAKDEARQAALDDAWGKRLAVWGSEQEAREKLMAQVLGERSVQVSQKLERAQREKEAEAEARRRLEAELAEIEAAEAAKARAAAAAKADYTRQLEHQIQQRRHGRAISEFNKVQEKESADRAEAAYQATLRSQLARTESQMSKYGPS
mmetsp:Transcript_47304/g.157644  ORF Transcript_47304/g.157644 Transcript_47304/m.157644 type:complete len:478 (+) Transcript_47304:24-1457(+)